MKSQVLSQMKDTADAVQGVDVGMDMDEGMDTVQGVDVGMDVHNEQPVCVHLVNKAGPVCIPG